MIGPLSSSISVATAVAPTSHLVIPMTGPKISGTALRLALVRETVTRTAGVPGPEAANVRVDWFQTPPMNA